MLSTRTRGSEKSWSASACSSRPRGCTTIAPALASATASTVALMPNSPPLTLTSTLPPRLCRSCTFTPGGRTEAIAPSLTLACALRLRPCPDRLTPVSSSGPTEQAARGRVHVCGSPAFPEQVCGLRRGHPQALRPDGHRAGAAPQEPDGRPRADADALDRPVASDAGGDAARHEPREQQLGEHQHQSEHRGGGRCLSVPHRSLTQAWQARARGPLALQPPPRARSSVG